MDKGTDPRKPSTVMFEQLNELKAQVFDILKQQENLQDAVSRLEQRRRDIVKQIEGIEKATREEAREKELRNLEEK